MTYYDEIEDAFAARLEPLDALGFKVQAFPDTEAEFTRQARRSRVTVALNNSYYGDSNSPGRPALMTFGAATAQEEFIELMVEFEGQRLRTPKGVYAAMNLADRLLLGWAPADGFRKTTFIKREFLDHADGRFKFGLTILTARTVVESANLDGVAGGLQPGDAPATSPLFREGNFNIDC